ncbi:hypothetical protein OSTOST_05264 [Ostertagia ostertagi]
MYTQLVATVVLITCSTIAVSGGSLEDGGYSGDSIQNYGGPSYEPDQNPANSPQAPSGEVIATNQGPGNLPLNPAGAPGVGSMETNQDSDNLPQGSSEETNEGRKRTIDLNDMIINATRLETRLRGHSTQAVITELISRLQRISPSDVRMLANPQRPSDNELVDSVLVANNLINIMIAASDEELFRRPPNVGALLLASNDIDNYIRTHQRNSRQEDRQF